MLVDLVFKGEKATYELASSLAKFAVTVISALGDGFQPIKDIPAIGAAAVQDLLPVAGDVALAKSEFLENKVAFMNSWMKAGEEFYDALAVSK